MCLTLRKDCLKPFNNSRVRYKVAQYNYHGDLVGPYRKTRYRKNHWHRAQMVSDWKDEVDYNHYGYHVYVDQKKAMKEAKLWADVLLTVEVKDFIRSGRYDRNDVETWKRFKIKSVDLTPSRCNDW